MLVHQPLDGPSSARLLVVDEDPDERTHLCRALAGSRYEVLETDRPDEAMRQAAPIDLVISRWGVRPASGLRFLRRWKRAHPESGFLVVSNHGEPSLAVEAMKLGADDYVTLPIAADRLLAEVRACLERDRGQRPGGRSGLVGQSAPMQRIYEWIEQAAAVDSTVLVTGESGTGKELVARAVHAASARRVGPWVAFNMAAVPQSLLESELFGHIRGAFTGAETDRQGRFQAADQGTLFLDEIGDVSHRVQAKLLRVLENRMVTPVGSNQDQPVDLRIIAATRQPVEDLVRRRDFRLDLYFRLNVIRIHLPPLRERPEDIPQLIRHFVQHYGQCYGRGPLGVSPALVQRLEGGCWPGNVRQLRNVIESMVVMARGPELLVEDLPGWFGTNSLPMGRGATIPPGMKLRELERMAVMQALERSGGHTAQAAASLGVSVRTLQRKLKKWAS